MSQPDHARTTRVGDGSAEPFALAAADAELLDDRLGSHSVAVVLGSGWRGIGDALGSTVAEVQMAELPGFASPTVAGHSGAVRSVTVDTLHGTEVRTLVLAGRTHLYEGRSASAVVHGVRTAVMNGCSRVILTNAAGSLRPEVGVMSPVLITDQINLTGANPLCGDEPPASFGGRFVDLSSLYSRRLIEVVLAAHPDIPEGVYAGLLGGTYETPAEIRMLATMGADLVGMSTVLESIAAHHLGAEVFGVSLVTNLAAGLQENLNHQEVLAAGAAASDRLTEIISTVVTAG